MGGGVGGGGGGGWVGALYIAQGPKRAHMFHQLSISQPLPRPKPLVSSTGVLKTGVFQGFRCFSGFRVVQGDLRGTQESILYRVLGGGGFKGGNVSQGSQILPITPLGSPILPSVPPSRTLEIRVRRDGLREV